MTKDKVRVVRGGPKGADMGCPVAGAFDGTCVIGSSGNRKLWA